MKHVYQSSGSRIGRIENLLLVSLLFFSIGGGYQLIQGSRVTGNAPSIQEMPLPCYASTPAGQDATVSDPEGSQLVVTGIPEQGARLEFNIRSFNRNARYILSFGDGRREIIRSQVVTHLYSRPGKFQVELQAVFDGKTEELYNGTLTIRPTAELAVR